MIQAMAENKAVEAALKAARAKNSFIRCYVFRVGTAATALWSWCLDMDATYIGLRNGTVQGDKRTLREVPQDGAPY